VRSDARDILILACPLGTGGCFMAGAQTPPSSKSLATLSVLSTVLVTTGTIGDCVFKVSNPKVFSFIFNVFKKSVRLYLFSSLFYYFESF
jgi:hypothetical protein